METRERTFDVGSLAKALVAVSLLLGIAVSWNLAAPGPTVAQGPIVLDGVDGAGEWDPSWQATTDPLDVYVTGTGNHPNAAPTYARSGYDVIGLWSHYDVAAATWYFRLDVDGRVADSDSATGTPGNLAVGTHDVDGGPLGGDSAGIGSPEAYRLWFQYQPAGPVTTAELAGNSAILPGVLAATTSGLTGQAVYSTTFNPGILEWAFARDVIVPPGNGYGELWFGAQMGDNSDFVSDDSVAPILLMDLDQTVGCPAAPAVIGSQATFPLDYAIPAAAARGANDVVLTADVPAGTSFVGASNGGTESGGTITWDLGDLASGDAGQVTFILQINDPLLTSLTINSEMTCAEGLQVQSSNDCPVQQPPPGLNLTSDCPADSIIVGRQSTFPLNYGIPASSIAGATNAVLTADVPAGASFVSASGTGTESGGVVTWNLGNLSPGDTGQRSFTLRVNDSMTYITISSEMTCDEGVQTQSASRCPVQQAPPPSEEVPEPGTFLLLGSGLAAMAGLMGVARARRRR